MNNYDLYYNYQNDMYNLNNIEKFNSISNSKFTDPEIAFERGNLFNNLYSEYKNYKPMILNPTNEQEYMLMLVQMYDFCAHELTLYLDNYPNDDEAIKLRNKYSQEAHKATSQYELKYSPLNLSSETLNQNPWAWDTQKWPWEGIN